MTENTNMTYDPFENAFYVQYDLQGGEGIVEQLLYVLPGSYFIVHDAPTKENYIFTGWQDQNGRIYEEGEIVFIEENLYITAQWELIDTLTFDLNGGEGNFATFEEKQWFSFSLPTEIPTKDGHYFMYWLSSDGTTYYPGDMYILKGNNDVLTAFYNRISSITFDLNGGEGDFPVYSEMETIYISLPENVPSKNGHRFVHWINPDGEVYEPGGLYIMKPTDDTLTAVWEEVELCTITFNTLGGTPEIPAITAYQYETFTMPETIPEKEGYYFSSWQEEETDNYYGPGEPIVVERSLNLQAYWHPNPYIVTYNLRGGNQYANEDYVYPDFTTDLTLPTPTKEGSTFLYWRDENNNTYNARETITVTGDMTLTAIWDPYTIVVYYNLDGGEGEIPNDVVELGYSTSVTSVIPAKYGFTFVHWIDENSNVYQTNDLITPTDDMTLTAVWQEKEKFTVSYNLDGGNGDFATTTVYSGEEYTIPSHFPYKEKHSFVYWLDEEDGMCYSPLFTITVQRNITLKAFFTEEFLLNFDLNGGEGDFSGFWLSENIMIYLPTEIPTKEGFEFLHWINSEGEIYNPEDMYIMKAKDDTLTAVWEEIKICSVDFDLDGGEGDFYPINKREGSYIAFSAVPEKEGYEFDGWMNNEGQIFSRYEFKSQIDTLHAMWKEKTYSVTYDLNGGKGNFSKQEKTYFAPLSLYTKIPTKESTSFVEWRTENGQVFAPGAVYNTNAPLSLKAFWQNEITYTVAYNLNGGEGNFPTQTKTHGTDLALYENIPTKEGYTFLHWSDEKGNTYLSGEVFTLNENVILNAVWTATLNFNLNGGEGDFETVTKTEGESIALSVTPQKTAYDFVSWEGSDGTTYSVGEEYIFNKGNDTLTAVWKEKVITVTYDLDGGEGFFPSQERYFTETKTVYDYKPTKEGYEFCYWRGSDNKYYDPSDIYEGEESVTLKAVWRRVYTITYLDRDGNVFATQQKRPSETIRLYKETPTHSSGHSFAYWMIKETGEYVAAGRKYKKDFDATLIPCYNISYDIAFYDSDKEIVFDSYGMLGGTRYIPSSVPEKSGYTFLCWNVDGTNTYYLPGEAFLLQDDMDFVAVWADNNDACIVYDLGEGEGDFPEQRVDYNVFVTMHSDVPTREGYVFDCWEVVRIVPEDTDLIGLKLAPGTVLTNEHSFVVRPVWLKAWVRIKNIPSGNTINLLETPSVQLEAEYFPTENDFSVIPTAMSARSVTNSNVIIYKEWISSDESVATVDQSGVVTFKKDGEVVISRAVTYTIGNIFQIYSSIRLRSLWGENIYTVSYDINGGMGTYEAQGKAHNCDIFIHSNTPIKFGEDFLGWRDILTQKIYFPTDKYIENRDTTLIAQWGESIPVTSVSMVNKSKTIGINEQTFLNVTIFPENATNQSLRWESSNSKIVDIDAYTGKIVPLKKGSTTITVSTLEGGFSDTCELTVDPRETVYIKKDGDFFNIEFPDGLVWKSIECNLDEDMLSDELWQPENFDFLTKPEQRFLFNFDNIYSEEEMAFIYVFDPLGVEYYMKKLYLSEVFPSDIKKQLFYKDIVYKKIFGEPLPLKFEFNVDYDTGTYCYGNYAGVDRTKYHTNAEVLFGFHTIFDASSFIKNLVEGIFTTIPIISDLVDGITIYQALFHVGSIAGLESSTASSFLSEYASQKIDTSIKDKYGEFIVNSTVSWAHNLIFLLAKLPFDALNHFVIPKEKDIIIYNKIKESEKYRAVFDDNSKDLSIEDILELCK